MKKIIKFLCICFVIFFSGNYSQSQELDCGTHEDDYIEGLGLNDIGAYLKPERTDKSDGASIPEPNDAQLKVLFVFVQFSDEDVQSGDWPIGEAPTFMEELLSPDKNPNGNYWERYSSQTEILSDYYQEVSRGLFHYTGITEHIELPNTKAYYINKGYTQMLEDIYEILKTRDISWVDLDRWSRNDSTGNFVYEDDGYIDMMGVIIRTEGPSPTIGTMGAGGYVPLLGPSDYLIDPVNNKKIGNIRNDKGSGFVAKGNIGPIHKLRVLGIAIHEYGHYLFDNNHSNSGIMTSRGGLSLNDFFYSGYEKYKLGYINATTVDFSSNPWTLNDVSGRDGTSNLLLKVPISSTEFFIIENRRKLSSYDVYMLGDTSKNNPFVNTGNYGKGVYIYHSLYGNTYATNNDVDVECADGLWNWTQQGTALPDWSETQYLPVMTKTSLSTNIPNDNGAWGGNYTNKDGISAGNIWFGLGKKHTQLHGVGTDKIYTNTPEWWTTREHWGDRWDAWNLGYNEIFSPYSNPNTKDKNNNNTGIFIQYTGLGGNSASIKVYKATDQNSLNSILQATPPSKPQILEIGEHWNGTNCNPKIVWRQNTEEDMVNTDEHSELVWKRYKIYKSGNLNGMSQLPQDQQFYPEQKYQHVATVDVNPSSTDASWVDPNVILYSCSYYSGEASGNPYPVRYRVQAVDKYNSSSVLSDYRQAIGVNNGGGEPIDPPEENPVLIHSNQNEIPTEYALKQNYPNPFNPTTNIQYDLPHDNFVMIKIYDITGRHVATLVNEFKKAGRYIISFNADKLSSGIYFYKIQAGNFIETKRMVLIK